MEQQQLPPPPPPSVAALPMRRATDTATSRAKTRSALLGGLRNGKLEAAVAKMEDDTATDQPSEQHEPLQHEHQPQQEEQTAQGGGRGGGGEAKSESDDRHDNAGAEVLEDDASDPPSEAGEGCDEADATPALHNERASEVERCENGHSFAID
jgi:hypothetical protein